MVKKGPSSFVWEREGESEVIDISEIEIIDELWDENIDYMLALRAILKAERLYDARGIAERVLNKHGKKESTE